MLENINDYSSGSALSHGVSLLGAAHRKAMVEKVQKLPSVGAPGATWNLESFPNKAV
jgi:hypothetical protein